MEELQLDAIRKQTKMFEGAYGKGRSEAGADSGCGLFLQ